jgi:hypothetical protein
MARAFKTGITSDGDVSLTGKLFVTASAGDEGGEIFLNKPVTNTSISGGVNIDVYQNKLRIWEDSGTNRGVYIDMTTAGAGVGTNLLGTATDTNYYPSAIVWNAGSSAGPTLDLTMSGSGAPDLTAVAIPSASATASGVVTTGTQTFAGTKTFSSTITADISGNSGTVTNGVYTTGDQTIGGAKTFSSPITSTHTGTWSSANIILQGNEPNIRFSETGQADANIGTNSGNFYILGDTDSSGVYDTTPFIVNLTSGNTTIAGDLTSANSAEWDTAYTDRLKWDGGSTGLTPATGRTSLGATTVGGNLFTLANPSVLSWPRINADNTVTARSASNTRSDLGLVIGTDVQAYDGDLGAIASLAGTSGVLKKTAANTWALDITIPSIFLHTAIANYTVASTTTANATISGQAFALTPTLAASTTYLFEAILFVQTTIGSGTGTNFTLSWTTGGAGTTGNVQYMTNSALASLTTSSTTTTSLQVTNFSSVTPISSPAGTQVTKVVMKGIVRSGASSPTIYPVLGITNGSTPGVPSSITTLVGSYMRFETLTASGSNVSIGTWV